MNEKDVVQLLNSQLDVAFTETMSMEEVEEKLRAHIDRLIQHDFQKLLSILYKIDVDENKLKKILIEQPATDAAEVIAKMILERQIQKIITRKQYKT